MNYSFLINNETCIGCHACVPVCPVEATFPEEELPEEDILTGKDAS